MMALRFISNWTPAMAAVLGGVVLVGWIAGVDVVKSLNDEWVTMKPLTAVLFMFSGVVLHACTRYPRGPEWVPAVGTGASMMVMLLCLFTIVGKLSGFAFWELLEPGVADPVKTVNVGEPSMGTVMSFLLVGLCGVLGVINFKTIIRWILGAVAGIGAVAILGYATGNPPLYFYAEGVSTAMALHTAVGFVLLGMTGINWQPSYDHRALARSVATE